MSKIFLLVSLVFMWAAPLFVFAQTNDDLDAYIQRLKADKAGPVAETGFMSAGSEFLYGQEYFDAKNYASAEWYFMSAVKKAKDNPFANYQLALSLIRQENEYKKQQAQEFLEAAFKLNASLKERYKTDVTNAVNKHQPGKKQDNTTVGTGTAKKPTGLEAYIESLKYSRTTGGQETSMGTAGREALYGIEYYEKNEFLSAETSFALALAKDPGSPYINYLMAVTMASQGKTEAAKPYLAKALAKDPSLKTNYNTDVAKGTVNWQKLKATREVKSSPAPKKSFGGTLVYGKYTCHQTKWNGPNVSPAYSYAYQGYFTLNTDGTYKWLNNGETGRYKYDSKTGNITWLSGHFKSSGARSTQYQVNSKTVQMSVNFKDPLTWECGCNKK